MRDKILEYVKSQEVELGGVIDIPGKGPSAILTAGLIPTLLDCGETAFAERCADWLVANQRHDGAWLNHSGLVEAFDVAYIARGMNAARYRMGDSADSYQEASDRAVFHVGAYKLNDPLCCIQFDAAMGKTPVVPQTFALTARTQWLLIAAEALPKRSQKMIVNLVRGVRRPDGLVCFNMAGDSSDIAATAMLGVLEPSMAKGMIQAIEPWVNADGSLPVIAGTPDKSTWVSKYVLDLYKAAE